MEATGLSLGKAVLDGALDYAKSTFAEEVALQLGVQRDHAFIRDELEMMRAFLMAAHDERDGHVVIKTWVKQVRDVAYDAEDSLQDFAVRLGKPSWWRIFRTLIDRRRVATRMKELRAKVQDVSQRNVRYQLIKGSGSSKAATSIQQSSMPDATLFGIKEARKQQEKERVHLSQLISNMQDEDLKVIAVWGTSGVPGQTAIIKRAYDDLKQKKNNRFEFFSWIRIMHPFNPTEFLQCIMRQFYVDHLEEVGKIQEAAAPGTQVLRKMGTMRQDDLVDEFHKHVSMKSYLIVLNDLSSIEEWDWIKTFFPESKKGCRIIVSTEKNEVASLCLLGQERLVLELKQSSADQNVYAFCDKAKDGTDLTEHGSSSNTLPTTHGDNNSAGVKELTRTETMMTAAIKYFQLIGREKEKQDIINKLISNTDSKQLEVITVCGMGGLGKTSLVKYVYESQEISAKFDNRACVTIKRPFNATDLLSSLLEQLEIRGNKMPPGAKLHSILERKKFLIVLDDLSSTTEWDNIKQYFPSTETSRIIITTREENLAKHCSKDNNIFKINFLEDSCARDLFTEKVFGKVTDLDKEYPELVEVAKLILKKCKGLPLAIETIGGFLSKQPKTPIGWRTLNEQIGAELEINEELGIIKDVLIKSYDGLPYFLKCCFLYMSIFPEDQKISRRRLVRRWIAEGYTSEIRGKSHKDVADSYFMELIERSMILPFQKSVGGRNGVDSCQLHDLMREISISKSMEENLVFRMEEGCSSNTLGITRHLSISKDWEGDQSEFENASDLSRIRSLTVFGKWRPFFISDKMSFLRVLDLEGTSNLFDHHLTEIGKLLHLKYLSVRGCGDIYHLPDSLGNLKQLQTLDIYGTRIIKLPQCISKLLKLQYIRAGGNDIMSAGSYEEFVNCLPKAQPRNKLGACAFTSILCALACCIHDARDFVLEQEGDSSRRDLCAWYCHAVVPFLARLADPGGVVVPRRLRKLRALHTLGVVNIARGKSILQEIGCLTQLRKLAVIGINKKNCQHFWSIVAGLSRLESLSVRSYVKRGLDGCLDDLSTPPFNLQSLKLDGKLVKLPEWIGGLHNLVKLKLEQTRLSEADGTMQVLRKLPNLSILRLYFFTFDVQKDGERCLNFRHFPEEVSFPSLTMLELRYIIGGFRVLDSVEFEKGAAPNLELLRFCGVSDEKHAVFSGLADLPMLKEFQLDNYTYSFEANVQTQLAENPNKPLFKKSAW